MGKKNCDVVHVPSQPEKRTRSEKACGSTAAPWLWNWMIYVTLPLLHRTKVASYKVLEVKATWLHNIHISTQSCLFVPSVYVYIQYRWILSHIWFIIPLAKYTLYSRTITTVVDRNRFCCLHWDYWSHDREYPLSAVSQEKCPCRYPRFSIYPDVFLNSCILNPHRSIRQFIWSGPHISAEWWILGM